MKLEIFPRKFEYFFSNPDLYAKQCKPMHITVASPYNKRHAAVDAEEFNAYIDDFKGLFVDFDKAFYDFMLKYIWLRSRFGYITRSFKNNDFDNNTKNAYGIFLRKFVEAEKHIYIDPRSGIESLFKRTLPILHPGFYESRNPFKENMEFPFKNLSIAHLLVVRDMDEMMDILEYADGKKMRYNHFLDFVSNWVGCYNEKYGEKYQMQIRPRMSITVEVVNLARSADRKSPVSYDAESKLNR